MGRPGPAADEPGEGRSDARGDHLGPPAGDPVRRRARRRRDLPSDGSVPALELLARGTDLVIGVRHPVWGAPTDLKDLVHRVGNLVLSYSASLLSRRPILDLCSGFWGVSAQRFVDLGLDDATFAIEAELVLKSIRRGYSIHQIPVTYHERLGEAKLRALRDGRPDPPDDRP